MSIEARPGDEPAHGNMPATDAAPGPLWNRLAWFVGLWTAGVAAVGTIAWLIRAWLH